MIIVSGSKVINKMKAFILILIKGLLSVVQSYSLYCKAC